MAHPNEEMLRRAYALFHQGDAEGFLEYCTQNVVFHFPGRSQFAGDYTGEELSTRIAPKIMELTGGSFTEIIIDVFANDHRGVVLETQQLSRDGKQFEYQTLHLWEIQDGKLTRFSECPLDLYKFDHVWA